MNLKKNQMFLKLRSNSVSFAKDTDIGKGEEKVRQRSEMPAMAGVRTSAWFCCGPQ